MENRPFHQRHYPGLDALRGVAILLVVFFHYFSFPVGWLGVDLFFVLSGFLITKTLLELKAKPNRFRNFFLRRVLRIFPVYFLTLIVFFVAAPFFFSEKAAGSVYAYYTDNQAWFWTFLQNWLFIKKGLPPEPYLQHFWSLAIEEQFYLCWPFLVFWVISIQQLRNIIVAIFLVSLFVRISLWFRPAGHDSFYYHTLARIDSLSIGGFLSTSVLLNKPFSKTQSLVIAVGFAALLTLSYAFYQNWRYDNALFATIGYSCSALFFGVICQRLVYSASQFRGLSLLAFFGRISYGLYVYHIPVFLVVSYLLQKYAANVFKQLALPVYFTSIISLVAAVVISFLSFRMIEQPVLNLKKWFTHPASKTVSHS